MTDIANRNAELRHMLSERRRAITEAVRSHIRDGRSGRSLEVGDGIEQSDADIQEDLEFALLQMRAETLTRIDEALARIDGGQYGSCRECGLEISERRLHALPFAVRCQACQERREQQHGHAQRRSMVPLFQHVISS
jgi:DnaK suppressor protein